MIKVIYKKDALSEEKTIEHAHTIGQWLTSKYESMPEHIRIFIRLVIWIMLKSRLQMKSRLRMHMT